MKSLFESLTTTYLNEFDIFLHGSVSKLLDPDALLLLNRFKLVYGPFEKCKMHSTLLSRPANKESNVPKLKSS
jgi:hypothetical protein